MVGQQAKTMEIHLEPKRNAEGGQTSRRGEILPLMPCLPMTHSEED